MQTPTWELIDSSHVLDRLEQDVVAANDRIVIQAMHVAHDAETDAIFEAITERAESNPDLARRSIVLPDAFSKACFDTDEQEAQLPQLLESLDTLGNLGLSATFGNDFGTGLLGILRRSFTSKIGRNHRKIYEADNVVYSFGGCNFNGLSFYRNHDYMLRTEHEEVADYLYGLVQADLIPGKPQDDEIKQFGEDIVIVDGGKRGVSTIQRVAQLIVREAESGTIRFVSQFRPADELEDDLFEKNPAMSVFNKSDQLTGSLRVQQMVEALSPPLPKIHYPTRYVHAKFISARLTPNNDRELLPEGGDVVLTGSHNFHNWGVQAGTQEIALLSSQESLVHQVNDWADRTFQPN